MSSIEFEFPPLYQFPPLFTRQPNKSIRIKQIETWINIIITNATKFKIWTINKQGTFKLHDINDNTDISKEHNFFNNETIDRSCSPLFINEIWQTMQRQGQLINKNGTKTPIIIDEDNETNSASKSEVEFYILWKSLDLWANEILEWFESTNQVNKVITFYEIVAGEDSINESFYSMPEPLLFQILNILVKRGRATMLKEDSKYVAIKVI